MKEIEELFKALRNNKKHHLGLGDIRLTIAQQDLILELISNNSLEYWDLRMREIKMKLIAWCKENKYSQGDTYSAGITSKGKWAVSYSNDYPLQHGFGKVFILTEEEFKQATK